MRLSRIMIAIAAGFALLGVPTAARAAQPFTPQPSLPPTVTPQPPYPPEQPALTSPDPTITVGQPVTLIGTGFGPGEPVRLSFSLLPAAARLSGAPPGSGGTGAMVPVAYTLPMQLPQPVEVRADGDGHVPTSVRIDQVGSILVTATGLTTGPTATLVLTVSAAQPGVSAPPPLLVTGSSGGPQITIGVAAVLAGVLLVLLAIAWRRRQGRGGRGAGSRKLESVH